MTKFVFFDAMSPTITLFHTGLEFNVSRRKRRASDHIVWGTWFGFCLQYLTYSSQILHLSFPMVGREFTI